MSGSSHASVAVNRLARRAAASCKLPRPRTFQPVRAGSRHRGDRERSWWRPVDPLDVRATIEAAKQHEIATKEPGKRNGALGRTAITILELMQQLVIWTDGTLEPSYSYIQSRTGLSIDGIAKALRRLSDEGFLKWIRRTQPVEDDGTGRYVEQIENAYRFEVPPAWRQRVLMRVTQLRERAKRAGQRWRDGAAEAAARAASKAAERVYRTRRWIEDTIVDPDLRASMLEDLEKDQAIPPGGEIHGQTL